MNTYEYSIAKDSKSESISGRSLGSALRALPFSGDLVSVQVQGDELRILFSRKLTAAEKKKLDAVIADHDGAAPDSPDERRGARLSELPPGLFEGQRTFVTDGRKIGEEKGRGTGVPVYWSGGAWLRHSDDKPATT